MKKSGNAFLSLSILWFVIAASLSVVIWGSVSMAAKIGFFATGFTSGICMGLWIAGRRMEKKS